MVLLHHQALILGSYWLTAAFSVDRYRAPHTNPEEVNCATINTYILGPAQHAPSGRSCRLSLLVQLMAQPCFNSLRTQQQLGYPVTLQPAPRLIIHTLYSACMQFPQFMQ